MKNADLDLIVQELRKRKKLTFNIDKYLFEEQLKFFRDESPYKIAVTSRRSGKSEVCAVDLMFTANETADCICLYVTLTRASAKQIVWPTLKRINRLYGLAAKFNEADLSVKFPNDSVIYCSGASDKSEIEKFRGLALKKVYIDECQSFPSYIEELINDVIAPALMDYAGMLVLIGTPGPIPSGFFWECSRSSLWSNHKWTFWQNPHIATKSRTTHEKLLQRELKRRGVDITNPSIRREWFGEWVIDKDSLVYHYDEEANDFIERPDLPGSWNYLLGVDIGYHDADALALLAWNDNDPSTYLVEEIVTKHQGITELVQQIELLRSKYDISKVVMDTAGLGKKIGEELSRRYKIAILPAEKQRKVEFIELMNDALRTGKLKAPKTSRFAQDCMKVEWDPDRSTPDKRVISKRFHSDICEAVLYGWRESYSYSHEAKKPKIKPYSKEWFDQQKSEMEEAAEEFFKRQEQAEDDPFGS